jgi:DDE_Tnp_1-associated
LLVILLIGACAVLAGARSFVAIAEYAHDAGRAVLDVVAVGGSAPEESTIRRVLNAVDAAEWEAALHAWALAHLELMGPPPGTPRREQRRVLALDGKTVRGARVIATSDSGEGGGESALVSRPHLVSVLDQASGVVPAQIRVEAKGTAPSPVDSFR